MNKTHVMAGHEVFSENSVVTRVESAFEICSNSILANDEDESYLCAPEKSSTGKWFHIAVVRFQHRATGGSVTTVRNAEVSYKVLVNGRPLQVAAYPGGPSRQREGQAACGTGLAVTCSKCTLGCKVGEYCTAAGTCASCAACPAAGQFRFGCRGTSVGTCELEPDRPCESGEGKCFENGESNLMSAPVAPTTNASSAGVSDYGKGAALVFGAYKGSSVFALEGAAFFDGALDEWRIWNGARSDSSILNNFRRVMSLTREQFYGDPSDPSRRVTEQNYLVSSVLMASWSFDQECVQSGNTGCALNNVDSVYPKKQDARLPTLTNAQLGRLGINSVGGGGKALYKAYAHKTVTGETDSQGRMFYSRAGGMEIDAAGKLTLHAKEAGEHQVVVLLSFPGNVAPVPVDFMVKVLPSECIKMVDGVECSLCNVNLMLQLPDYKCVYDKTPGVKNEFMPNLGIKSAILPAYSFEEEEGNVYYVGGDAVADMEANLYPYQMRVYAGFELKLGTHSEKSLCPIGFGLCSHCVLTFENVCQSCTAWTRSPTSIRRPISSTTTSTQRCVCARARARVYAGLPSSWRGRKKNEREK